MSPSYDELFLFIDGEWIDRTRRETSPVINPAPGSVIGHVPHAQTEDLDRALRAADRGFKVWRATPAYDRAKVLRRAAELLRERAESISRLLTL